MAESAFNPHLRLVGTQAEPNVGGLRRSRSPRPPQQSENGAQVAKENQRARNLQPLSATDPRWAVAVRAQSMLQGSVLEPNARQRVMRTARTLGVRPFDANLIMALVQDRARRGEDMKSMEPVLRLIDPPTSRARNMKSIVVQWIVAIVTAVVANLLLIWWVLGGQ